MARRARTSRTLGSSTMYPNAAFVLLAAVLATAPLILGSHRPITWILNGSVVALALLALAIDIARNGPAVPFSRLAIPLGGGALVCAYVAFQLAPIGGPLADPTWNAASEALGIPLIGSISVDRDATLAALLRALTYFGVFILALQLGRTPRRARLAVALLFWAAVFYACYGLLVTLSGSNRILFFDRFAYEGVVTGTFIARNAFAALLGIGLVCGTVLLVGAFDRIAEAHRRDVRLGRAAAVEEITRGGGRVLLGSLPLLSALMLTGSRAGVAASLAGAASVFLLWRFRSIRSRAALRIAAIGGAVLVVGAIAISGATVVERLEDTERSAAFRAQLYGAALDAIVARPLAGGGAGAYPALFPEVRPPGLPTWRTYGEAHNTYLELAATLGLPMTAVLLAVLAALVARAASALWTRRRDHAAPLAATGAAVLFALHSLVDFSLQIQANALWLSALLGFGVAQSWRRGSLPEDRRHGAV